MYLHTEKSFRNLIKSTEIRLYLSFSDWFVTKRTLVLFQINRKMVNTILFRDDLIRFRKYFFVCRSLWNNFIFNSSSVNPCIWECVNLGALDNSTPRRFLSYFLLTLPYISFPSYLHRSSKNIIGIDKIYTL